MRKELIKVFHPYHKEVSRESFYIQGDLILDMYGLPEKIQLRAPGSLLLVDLLKKEIPNLPETIFTAGVDIVNNTACLLLDVLNIDDLKAVEFTQETRNYVRCDLISYDYAWKMSTRDRSKLH